MRGLSLLLALVSCAPSVAVAQTSARPSIAGCGTAAIVRADRARPDRLEDQAACFERAAEIATGAAAERRALLVPAPAPAPSPAPTPAPILVPGAAWTRCAVEDAACIFTGRGEVRYGANGTFVTKVADSEIRCSNAAFGGDPLHGIPKACDVRAGPVEPLPLPDVRPTPLPVDEPPGEAGPLDPVALLAEWQPRFAALGFRLEIGPREPLPTTAAPDQHRWPVALWQGEHDLQAYYAVFAPALGSEEALATGASLVASYLAAASHLASAGCFSAPADCRP